MTVSNPTLGSVVVATDVMVVDCSQADVAVVVAVVDVESVMLGVGT